MVWTGYAPDQINWDIWPCDIWRGMFLCAGLTHRSLFYSISSTWSSFCPWKLYSEIHNLRKRRQRRGRSLYENVLNLHSQHVSIVRQGFRWMTFTFSPLRHAPCAPGVLRMLSKCHWSRLQLTQILLCPSTRSYYTPPMFFHSSPFPRHCPGIPYVSSEGCWGHSCTREGRRGGN